MKNFWVRSVSAVVYVALFLGCIYSGALLKNQLAGGLIFTAFLLFVACGCAFEFFRIVGKQGAMPCRPLGYFLTAAALLMVALVPVIDARHGFALTWLVYTIFPMLFAVVAVVQLWYHSEQPFRDAAYTMVPMLYAAIPLGLMPWLHVNYNVLVMVLIMVWMNDNGAYMGGVITLLVAVFVGPLFNAGIAWYHWLALGLICSVIDTLGDLVESMLKRSVGMKDSGSIMPGHGGFLDRFDSLLIATPCVYVYLTFFVQL